MEAAERRAAAQGRGAWELSLAGVPARIAAPSTRQRIGLVGLLATGLVIALAADHTRLLLPAPLRRAPGFLAGAFGSVGLDIGVAGMAVALALMFASYALALLGAGRLSRRAVLFSIAALNALVLLAPPLLSTDLFSYIAYGRLGATYGINPYLHGPSAVPFDPLYQLIGVQWTHTPTVYGPLFTALSYPLSGLGIAADVLAYKAIAALSCLVIVVLVWQAARLRGLDPVKAAALVGLNPVIVVYGVGGGHNDLLMLAILVAGIYVLLRQRAGAGGAMIVAATAVKLTAGVLLPFAVAAGAGRRMANARRGRVIAGAVVASALFAAMGAAMFGSGPMHVLATLTGIQADGGSQSVPGFILSALGLKRYDVTLDHVLHGAYAIGLVWLVRRVWIGRLDWITAAGWATVGLLLTAGMLMPWYVAWLIPLAALSSDRRLRLTAIALTSIGLTTL
ncbi:MAG: glycosyltransferase family 87 protein [Solirubrobacteraceae bacterium]